MKEEIWREIIGYEELYQVSDQGRVRSIERVTIRGNGRPKPVRQRVLSSGINPKTGYRCVALYRNGAGKTFTIPRLLAIHFLGLQGDKVVEHINGVRDDDRLENLRVATQQQNMCNRATRRDSATGIKGVEFRASGYTATITAKRKKHYLGRFRTAEEAASAYAAAAVRLHGEFANTGSAP